MDKSQKKICPICKKEKDVYVADVCAETFRHLVEKIKKDHPEWIDKDGLCPKCIEYYKRL